MDRNLTESQKVAEEVFRAFGDYGSASVLAYPDEWVIKNIVGSVVQKLIERNAWLEDQLADAREQRDRVSAENTNLRDEIAGLEENKKSSFDLLCEKNREIDVLTKALHDSGVSL